MTADELKVLFNQALIEKDPIPQLVTCIYEGLKTDKVMAGQTIPDGTARLNFAKFLAECLHIVEPTAVKIDSSSTTEEILARVSQLVAGANSENPPEAE